MGCSAERVRGIAEGMKREVRLLHGGILSLRDNLCLSGLEVRFEQRK
jgi:hypothetical protein